MGSTLLAGDRPGGLTSPGDGRLERVRQLANGPLALQAEAIDRDGFYPVELLRQLAAAGAADAHLATASGPGDYLEAVQAIAEVSRVCGATGFLLWCQAVCGLYLEQSANPQLTGAVLERHRQGLGLGGTALSNPMKSYAGIERLLLKAVPVDGGYRVSGSLPWVSHLAPDHYCGAIAAVEDPSGGERELMFLLRGDAPGVELLPCPPFSGMEGTGTYGLRLNQLFVGSDEILADPARPTIARIRSGFVLLQCGIAAGVSQGAIDSMLEVRHQQGGVNRFLPDGPEDLQQELDSLMARVAALARQPLDPSDDTFLAVLEARADGAELSLRAAQAALLHQGARGYRLSSAVQRRVRESHFVAIVTPAIKHLRKEIARLRAAQASS